MYILLILRLFPEYGSTKEEILKFYLGNDISTYSHVNFISEQDLEKSEKINEKSAEENITSTYSVSQNSTRTNNGNTTYLDIPQEKIHQSEEDSGECLFFFRDLGSNLLRIEICDRKSTNEQDNEHVEMWQSNKKEIALPVMENSSFFMNEEAQSRDDSCVSAFHTQKINKTTGIESKKILIMDQAHVFSFLFINSTEFNEKIRLLRNNIPTRFRLKEIYGAVAVGLFMTDVKILGMIAYNLLKINSAAEVLQFHLYILLNYFEKILKTEELDEIKGQIIHWEHKTIFYLESSTYLAINQKIKQTVESIYNGEVPEEFYAILNFHENLTLFKRQVHLKAQLDLLYQKKIFLSCLSSATPEVMIRLDTRNTDLHTINLLYKKKILIYHPSLDDCMINIAGLLEVKYYDLLPSLIVEFAAKNEVSLDFIMLIYKFQKQIRNSAQPMQQIFMTGFKYLFYEQSAIINIVTEMAASTINHTHLRMVDIFLCRYFLRREHFQVLTDHNSIGQNKIQSYQKKLSLLYDLISPCDLNFWPEEIYSRSVSNTIQSHSMDKFINSVCEIHHALILECNQKHINLCEFMIPDCFTLVGQMNSISIRQLQSNLNVFAWNNYVFLEFAQTPSENFILSHCPTPTSLCNARIYVHARTFRINLHQLMLITSKWDGKLSIFDMTYNTLTVQYVQCKVLGPLCGDLDVEFNHVEFLSKKMVLNIKTATFNSCIASELYFSGEVDKMFFYNGERFNFSLDHMFLSLKEMHIYNNSSKIHLHKIILDNMGPDVPTSGFFMIQREVYISNYSVSGTLLLPDMVENVILDSCILSQLIIPQIPFLKITRCTGNVIYADYGNFMLSKESRITKKRNDPPTFSDMVSNNP